MTYTQRTQGVLTFSYDLTLNEYALQVTANGFHLASDPLVGKTVSPDDAITGDGVPRVIITINDQFPGPSIEVMEGAQVVVKVTNKLYLETATIHFHGQFQEGTSFMDGVAYLSQCPILPRQTFTHRFTAKPAGTHWYHAHNLNQMSEGLMGMFIVHREAPPIPYWTMMVGDWIHDSALTVNSEDPIWPEYPGPGNGFVVNPPYFAPDGSMITIDGYQGGLINGRGRWNGNQAPLSVFNVTKGIQCRFRVVNSGLEQTMKVEIDRHSLQIVALDGHDIDPVTVNSFYAMPGERVDFILTANAPTNSYWIRATTLISNVETPQILAILKYSGAPDGDPTSQQLTDCTRTATKQCVIFNCVYEYPASANVQCINVDNATASFESTDYGTLDAPDQEIFLNLVFAKGPSINGITNTEARSLVYGQGSSVNQYIDACDATQCATFGCFCSNIISLPFNKTIQVVVTSLANPKQPIEPHPFHLHGHNFAVLKIAFRPVDASGTATGTNPDIVCVDKLCLNSKWANGPPKFTNQHPVSKDTVAVPAGGYAVFRYKTANPGWWIAHCHLEPHAVHGMSVFFNEAEKLQALLPAGFPTCPDLL